MLENDPMTDTFRSQYEIQLSAFAVTESTAFEHNLRVNVCVCRLHRQWQLSLLLSAPCSEILCTDYGVVFITEPSSRKHGISVKKKKVLLVLDICRIIVDDSVVITGKTCLGFFRVTK